MYKFFTLFLFTSFLFNFSSSYAQEILLFEDFNQCAIPEGWNVDITNDLSDGFIIGTTTNVNSDSSSIDGSCMLIFDDDILGADAPHFRVEVTSPIIQTKDYQSIRLETDVHFRQYGSSYFTIFLEDLNGERYEIRNFEDGDQTGNRFSEFVKFSADLRFITDLTEFRIVYVYDDGDIYAWWAGMDNVSVIGSGEGEVILSEQFNDCSIPQDWSTNILAGEHDWQFGEIDNSNSSNTSMNGSCFVYFDDDGIGQDAAFSKTELISPWIDGSAFSNFSLDFDLIIRRYSELEGLSIFIYDGTDYTLVREFNSDVAGPQFGNYEFITIDLTQYRSLDMQIVFRFDDGNSWGWWTGIDNVKVVGSGKINDVCSAAEKLEIGDACLNTNNSNAIFSGPLSDPDRRQLGSLWYTISAPADGILKIKNESNYNDILEAFSGTCDDLTIIQEQNHDEHGFDGEIIYLNVEKNADYLLRVSGVVSRYGKYKGQNCLSLEYVNSIPQLPIADQFSGMVELGLNEAPFNISNRFATESENDLDHTNDLYTADLWFVLNIDQDASDIEIDLNTEFAENVLVYKDNNPIHSQEYGGAFKLLDLSAGSYIIRVSGTFATIEGEFSIVAKTIIPEAPVADDCFQSKNITLDNLYSENNEWNIFSGHAPSCDILVENDIWFTFNSGNVEDLYLDFDSDFPNTLSVYSGNCDDLEEIWCEKNLDKCQGSIAISDLETNTDYYLQVASSTSNNNIESGFFEFVLSSESSEYEAIDLIVNTICQEDGAAQLEIIVSGSDQYELTGNNSLETLFEGEQYIVVATDVNGCEVSRQGVISCQSDNCSLIAESYLTYPSCAQTSDGKIIFEVEGGLAPYHFEWDHTSENTNELVALKSGTYSVKITDFNGCISFESYEIMNPDALFSEITTSDQVDADLDDGTASVQVSGGVFPYTFEWSNGDDQQNVINLAPGTYSVTITDYNGCTYNHDFIINALDCVFEIEASVNPISCFGIGDGKIDLASDVEITSVSWNNGDEGISITNLEAGTYIATITAENGCVVIKEYTLEEMPQISATYDLISVLCYGEANGKATISPQGGTGDIQIEWEDGNTELIRDDLVSKNYSIFLTDSNNCKDTVEIFIEQPDSLLIASSMTTDLNCFESQDGSACVFIEGGTMPYNFVWSETEQETSKITDLPAGDYNLTMTDINGCTIETALSIAAPPILESSFINFDITSNSDGFIEIQLEGGTAPYTIEWFNEDGELIGSGEKIENLGEGQYYAQITDNKGCFIETDKLLLLITATKNYDLSAIEIYPNPAKEMFKVQSTELNLLDYKFDLINDQGKIVSNLVRIKSQQTDEILIQNEELLSGIYYVILYNASLDERIKSKALIIIE